MAQPLTPTITIRPAYADDDAALARLAALDSADTVPARPLLLAEADGELRAALSIGDGSVIADPFVRTLDLIELLRTHAEASSPPARRGLRSDFIYGRRRNRSGRRRSRALLVG